MNCPSCGSTEIEKGVAIGKTAETGNIGPKYSWGLLAGVAQMYCDICPNCGEIMRFFIKERTDRKWIKKPGALGTK